MAVIQNLKPEDQSQEPADLPSASTDTVPGEAGPPTSGHELAISYRAMLDGTISPILIANADGQYVEVNSAASEILDYSESELLRMTVDDLEARPDWTTEGRLRFIRLGQWDGPMSVRAKSGDLIALDARVTLVHSPDQTLYLTSLRAPSSQIDAAEARAPKASGLERVISIIGMLLLLITLALVIAGAVAVLFGGFRFPQIR